MSFKILISAPYMRPLPKKYAQFFKDRHIKIILPPIGERLSEKELLEYIEDIDGVISGDDAFTRKVVEKAKKLKVISKWGTGIDSIDLEVCRERGVRVCNTPNAFTLPVADSVLGYMLCFARKLPWMNENVKKGFWEKIGGTSLSECVLGVIGVGNVGKAVVERARAFGMKVLGYDIQTIPDPFLEKTGLEMTTKEALIRESDFISLNCDLNPTSFHILGPGEFSAMKATAVIINTARGPLIDEPALIDALQQKKIGGAGLDVFEAEPLPKDNLLRTFPNVLLAPHNANSSPKCWDYVHERTVRNLMEGLEQR